MTIHTLTRNPETERLESDNPQGRFIPLPAQVTGVTQGVTTSSSIVISWTLLAEDPILPIATVIHYRVYRDGVLAQDNVPSNAATLSGLTAGIGYNVSVSAVNIKGEGPQSAVVPMATSPAAQPGDPEGSLSVLKAFPTAEGAGALSVGGRGGTVMYVDSLADSGAGTLRAACEASGPRIVVFRVSGNIVLEDAIFILNPNITIAGQTAPGGGIQVLGKNPGEYPIESTTRKNFTKSVFSIGASDVIIQYLRIRPGYLGPDLDFDVSAFRISNSYSGAVNVSRVIIDHCSLNWCSSNLFTIWDYTSNRTLRDITVQYCLGAEMPYRRYGHNVSGGPGQGAKAGDFDIHHNFLGRTRGRMPLTGNYKHPVRFTNNIYYATSGPMGQVHGNVGESVHQSKMDFVGNRWDFGRFNDVYSDWRANEFYVENVKGTPTADQLSLYLAGNWGSVNGYDNVSMARMGRPWSPWVVPDTLKRTSPTAQRHADAPVTIDHVDDLEAMLPKLGAYQRLDSNGQWVGNRDSVDTRVVTEYTTTRSWNTLLEHEEDVGGFPTLAAGEAYISTAGDGIADGWKTRNGLDPATDYSATEVLGFGGWTYMDLFLAGFDIT